jgi:hypothetical protein
VVADRINKTNDAGRYVPMYRQADRIEKTREFKAPQNCQTKKRGRLRPNPSRPGPLGRGGGVALLPLPHADTDGRGRFRSGGGARQSGRPPVVAGGAAPDPVTLCPDPVAALEAEMATGRNPSGRAVPYPHPPTLTPTC